MNERIKRYSHNAKKTLSSIFFFIISVAFCHAADTPDKIKAGFYEYEGYHHIDENGKKSGYGYDFLRMTQKFANINYEYIGYDKDVQEIREMLLSGEIDILTPAHKTRELEELFDFSLPIGTNTVNINTRYTEESIIPGDYSTYNGIRIGLIEGSYYNKDIEDFALQNNFAFTPVYFKDYTTMENALRFMEIDAIGTSSLRKSHYEKVLSRFNTECYYAIVKKGNLELLGKINYAINQMNDNYGDWKNTLHNKNFILNNEKGLYFTKEEKEYIKKHSNGANKICIATDNDWKPFSWKKGDQFHGIMPSLIDVCLDMCGMDYYFYQTEGSITDVSVLNDADVNLYLGYSLSGIDTEEENLITSPSLLNSELAYLTRRDNSRINTVAISKTTPYMNNYFTSIINVPIVSYKNTNAAVKAVLNKEADAALLYIYEAEHIVNQDNTRILSIQLVPVSPIDIKAAIRENENHLLISIISKCINHISETEKLSIVSKFISYSFSDSSILDYIFIHPILTVSVIFIFLILLCALSFVLLRSKIEKTHRNNLEDKVNRITTLNLQLQDNQTRLEEARKEADSANHAKTIFLNNMSHDIRTPMNAIIGFANLMENHTENPVLVSDYLAKIKNSGEYLLSIINNVLDMASIDSGSIKLDESIMDLHKTHASITEPFESMILGKKLSLCKTIDISHRYAMADITRMNQILVNLLSNAIKYTPDEGNISFDLSEQPCDREGYASYTITISDSGIGMSKEFLSHIFDSFSRERTTTESKVIGTGLGMSIVKKLVDLMGGTIEVDSQLGKGTTFTFRFALKAVDDQIATAETGIENTQCRSLSRKHRILLTEDNELNAEIAITILEEAGFTVEHAEDGVVCVDKIQKAESNYFDLILMDIQMPNMDGYRATQTIRSMADTGKNSIPIIAMTANAFEEDKKAARQAGMNGHVSKPINVQLLLAEISRLLG